LLRVTCDTEHNKADERSKANSGDHDGPLLVIGMAERHLPPWSIDGVEFAVNRQASSEQPSYLSSRFHGK
jgi:hypothetical protein